LKSDPGMKRADLLALAKQAGVRGRSRMTKKQLIEVLAALTEASGEGRDRTPASETPSAEVLPPPPPLPGGPPELPALLEENRIALLPQGPRTAFAYWESSGEYLPDLVLRVVMVPEETEIASHDVRGPIGSYYLHLDQAGIQIEVLLGVVKDGRFHQILRSNRIRLPDDSPSSDLPKFWMTRKDGVLEITPLSKELVRGGALWGAFEDRPPGYPVSSWIRGRGKEF